MVFLSSTAARSAIDVARMNGLARAIQRDSDAIATGRALSAASDDPAAAARLSQLGRQSAETSAWQDNLALVDRWTTQRDSLLGEAGSLVDRARELVSAGLSGTASREARIASATELAGLADALRQLPQAETLVASGSGALSVPVGQNSSVIFPTDLASLLSIDSGQGPAPIADWLDQAAASLAIDDPATRATAGATVIAALSSATNHIIDQRAITGALAAAADIRADNLSAIATDLTEQTSALSQTDIAAAIARIQSRQLTLDAAQSLFARLNRSTLFDLLR